MFITKMLVCFVLYLRKFNKNLKVDQRILKSFQDKIGIVIFSK